MPFFSRLGQLTGRGECSVSDEIAESLRALKQELSLLLRPANNITSKLKDVVKNVEAALREHPSLPGILRIPEEILTPVFGLTCELDKCSPFLLIQTRRRFREVGLKCKELWTTISSRDLPEVTKFRLLRSGSMGLTISLWPEEYWRFIPPDDKDKFFQPVDKDNRYIERRSLWTGRDGRPEREALRRIRRRCNPSCLSSTRAAYCLLSTGGGITSEQAIQRKAHTVPVLSTQHSHPISTQLR